MNDKKYVVNFFAGPGAGKSTTAAKLFGEIKSRKVIKCELVTEYAKELVYSNQVKILTDYPDLIFATQRKRLNDALGVVDLVIMDTSLIFSTLYHDIKSEHLINYIYETYRSYNNINIFVNRDDSSFEDYGRIHNEEESKLYDEIMADVVSVYDFPVIYHNVKDDIKNLTDKILKIVNNDQ